MIISLIKNTIWLVRHRLFKKSQIAPDWELILSVAVSLLAIGLVIYFVVRRFHAFRAK